MIYEIKAMNVNRALWYFSDSSFPLLHFNLTWRSKLYGKFQEI